MIATITKYSILSRRSFYPRLSDQSLDNAWYIGIVFSTITFNTPSKLSMPKHANDLQAYTLLDYFPALHLSISNCRTLRLDNNTLSGLPEGLLSLTSLTCLTVRHNNFSNLPYRFGDLRFLQKLDLGENMLKTLPATMVTHSILISVYLSIRKAVVVQ